jgi:hypothetical protein
LLMVMIAKRKKRKNPGPDNRLPAPAITEVNQSKSTQTKLTSPASPTQRPMSPMSPGSSSRTQVL